jgi:hypothetical protein
MRRTKEEILEALYDYTRPYLSVSFLLKQLCIAIRCFFFFCRRFSRGLDVFTFSFSLSHER